jgi:membrane protein
MKWLTRIIKEWRLYRLVISWSKRTTLPGFDRLPLYTVADFFIKELGKESLTTKASALAFNFLLAIFPATIFLFTLIPYIPIQDFQDQLMYILLQVLPKNAFLAVQTTLLDIIENQNGGLLSLGFVSALFFATNGVMALMRSFNKSSLILETRSGWKQRMVATFITILFSLLIVVGISMIVAGEFFITLLKKEGIIKGVFLFYSLLMVRWLIILALFLSVISTLYYFGPATVKKFRFISAGSTLATVLSILTSLGFAFYVNNFSSYNKLYGSIGTLIVVMLWLFINSLILLIGFELNASIDIVKRNLPPPEPPRRKNRLKIGEEERSLL